MSQGAKGWGEIDSGYTLALRHESEGIVAAASSVSLQPSSAQSQPKPQLQRRHQQSQKQNQVQWKLAQEKVLRFRLHETRRIVSATSAVSSTTESALSLPSVHSLLDLLQNARQPRHTQETVQPTRKPLHESLLILPSQHISTSPGRNCATLSSSGK